MERHFDLRKAVIEFSSLFSYDEPNDRAIAVIGGAFLDTLLLITLHNFLPENDKEVIGLFENNNPLATYSSRIKMTYCLGLIDRLIKDDLKLIGKIRNKFAHDLNASFSNDDVGSWCKALKWHKVFLMQNPPDNATNRDLFQVGVNTLISHLHGITLIAIGQKRKSLDEFYK